MRKKIKFVQKSPGKNKNMVNTIDCNVILLPTDKSCLIKHDDTTFTCWGKPVELDQPQHMYFTSDEKINKGDLYMLRTNINGKYILSNDWKTCRHNTDKKVVASTNELLNLPSIPQSFLFQYVKANGKIDKVKIRIKNVTTKKLSYNCGLSTYTEVRVDGKKVDELPEYYNDHFVRKHDGLKLTTDNEVILVDIHINDDVALADNFIKEKQSSDKKLKKWTDDDLIQFALKCCGNNGYDPTVLMITQ